MRDSRPARTGLLLLLLLAVGGAYLYQSLDALIEHRVRQALLAYGVVDYRLEAPRLGTGSFSARRVWLRGTYEGLEYDITLDTPAVEYDWRILLTRRARSIRVSGLDIALAGTGPAQARAPGTEPLVITTADLLPGERLASLPAEALDIDRLHITYRAPTLPDLEVTGRIRYGEQLDAMLQTTLAGGALGLKVNSGADPSALTARLALEQADNPVAQVSAQLLAVARDEREWRAQGEWQLAPLLEWLRGLAAATGLLPASALPDGMVLAGRGKLDGRIRHPDRLRVDTALGLAGLQALEASLHVDTDLEQLDYPGVLAGLTGAVNATATLEQGRLRIAVASGALSGHLAAGLPEDNHFALEDLELETTVTPGATATLDSRFCAAVTFRLRQQKLPRLSLALSQRGVLAQSALEATLSDDAGNLDLSLAGTLDLTAGSGELDLGVRSDNLGGLAASVLPAMRTLGVLRGGLDIESGSLKLDTHLATPDLDPDHWVQTSDLSLDDVSGLYRDYRFDSLALSAGWRGIREWQTSRPLSLSLGRLDAGFAITDISARATLPRPTPITRPAVSIESFSAHLFGGEVDLADPISWDFGAGSNTLTLRARQWQLARIVALQQNEDIRAQGVLEGELPLAVSDGRVVIERGYLRALPPGGRIQYHASDASRALGANSGELDLALRLLSDFRYEELSSTVALDSTGDLLLGLSLAGNNPEEFEGRKVNFNINLEQNIDPLLQSLRLSGKLTDEIENRLR